MRSLSRSEGRQAHWARPFVLALYLSVIIVLAAEHSLELQQNSGLLGHLVTYEGMFSVVGVRNGAARPWLAIILIALFSNNQDVVGLEPNNFCSQSRAKVHHRLVVFRLNGDRGG